MTIDAAKRRHRISRRHQALRRDAGAPLAVNAISFEVAARHAHDHPRAVRLRQDDDAAHDRRARGADRRAILIAGDDVTDARRRPSATSA